MKSTSHLKAKPNVLAIAATGLLSSLSMQVLANPALTADAMVSSKAPTKNAGAAAAVSLLNSGTATQTGLLKFNLSNSLPAGSVSNDIAKATLKLFVSKVKGTGTINIDTTSTSWQEASVNGASAITASGSHPDNKSVSASNLNQWLEFDVTDAVKAGVSTADIAFVLSVSTGLSLDIDSKESKTTSHAAILDILYAPAGLAATVGQPCSYQNASGNLATGVGVIYTIKGDPGPTVSCAASEGSRYIDLVHVVVDKTTNLMWEKKSAAGTGDIHDVDTPFTWSTASNIGPANGTIFTQFLPTLNTAAKNACTLSATPGSSVICSASAQPGCFANHCDWRLPELDELKSIVEKPCVGVGSKCLNTVFGPAGTWTWSATSVENSPTSAWYVQFGDGGTGTDTKNWGPYYVRAVRGNR